MLIGEVNECGIREEEWDNVNIIVVGITEESEVVEATTPKKNENFMISS